MEFSFINFDLEDDSGRFKHERNIVPVMKRERSALISCIILICFNGSVLLSSARLNVPDIGCFNDYLTTMVCHFTSEKPLDCSGYIFDVVLQDPELQKHYQCTLMTFYDTVSNDVMKCGCSVEIKMGFVNDEKFNVSLREGLKVINSTIINTTESIKPRAPEILSVKPTESGDYIVTWSTTYSSDDFLYESLLTELRYKKKGEADADSRTLNASLPSVEILGSHLESRQEYVVKARSYSLDYRTQYSDWSREERWTVPASVQDVLTVVIPCLCSLLILIICVSYWFCTRLKAKWWDTVPSPTKDLKCMLPGNPKVFIPKHYDPSGNLLDVLTVESAEKKRVTSWITEYDQDDPYKDVSGHKDSTVGSSDSGQKSVSDCADSSGSSGYRNVVLPEESVPSSLETSSQEEQGNKPHVSSDCLSVSPTIFYHNLRKEGKVMKTPSVLEHLHRNLEALDMFRRAPETPTDYEYQACNGVIASTPPAEGAGLTSTLKVDVLDALLSSSPVNTCRVDDGYESYAEALGRTAREKAHYPACILSPCEDGYQDLQSLAGNKADYPCGEDKGNRVAHSVDGPEKCPGKEWELSQCPKWGIPTTCASQLLQNSSLESPPPTALTTLPNIQTFTDSCYHRV